jgi:hypothetical protein
MADLSEEAVADHHPRAAGVAMFQPNEPGITVFRVEVGPLLRQDVGMKIDLHGFEL